MHVWQAWKRLPHRTMLRRYGMRGFCAAAVCTCTCDHPACFVCPAEPPSDGRGYTQRTPLPVYSVLLRLCANCSPCLAARCLQAAEARAMVQRLEREVSGLYRDKASLLEEVMAASTQVRARSDTPQGAPLLSQTACPQACVIVYADCRMRGCPAPRSDACTRLQSSATP